MNREDLDATANSLSFTNASDAVLAEFARRLERDSDIDALLSEYSARFPAMAV